MYNGLAKYMLLSMWWSIFFYCLQQIETPGEQNPDTAIGAAGELGRYQILPDYWQDAVEYDPTIGGVYEDVVKPEYSQKIIMAYIHRYAIRRGVYDPVKMARIHNGGPTGWRKQSTIKYGEKFSREWNNFFRKEGIIN